MSIKHSTWVASRLFFKFDSSVEKYLSTLGTRYKCNFNIIRTYLIIIVFGSNPLSVCT